MWPVGLGNTRISTDYAQKSPRSLNIPQSYKEDLNDDVKMLEFGNTRSSSDCVQNSSPMATGLALGGWLAGFLQGIN